MELVSDVLAKLTEFRLYSWEELQERPLPEGINSDQLEMYLADEDFEVSASREIILTIFKVTR